MERQRLIKLIENKGTSSKEETSDLWDIVRTFPYFQTARLLLVKSFHNQSSIHFHSELKTAAAYSGDRKVLFHLINDETTKQATGEDNNVFVIEEKQSFKEEPFLKLSETDSKNQFKLAEENEDHIEAPVFEIKEPISPPTESKIEYIIPETKYREEPKVKEEQKVFVPTKEIIEEKKRVTEPAANSAFDEPSSNEEIIRKRLSEILAKNKPEQAKKEEPETNQLLVDPEHAGQIANSELLVSIESNTTEEKPISHSVLDELPAEPADEIEGLEIETIIEENYLQELEKLPEIVESVTPNEEKNQLATGNLQTADRQLPTPFIDWLKQKSGGHTTIEEVKDEPLSSDYDRRDESSSSPSGDREALINKFIATAPRITPVKAEFYSPANMARQSIMDNEDIISETLAQIYFDQENYAKARSCYEKLILLYPEKSASFAPLIEKIDSIIRNQT